MKPFLLLQTDFSNTWGAVASMKGVIKLVDPALEIYDLCHDIRTFDPWEASLSLAAVEPYWPAGTVIVSVVDPGVGTARRSCVALLNDGTYVVTPDNGTLTHLKHGVGIKAVREIGPEHRFPAKEEVSVFHGRDIFAYCAARLAAGQISFAEVGPEYPAAEAVECPEFSLTPEIHGDTVNTWLMTGLAHFGGVQFYLSNEAWERMGHREGESVRVTITCRGETVFDRAVLYGTSFGSVPVGEPVLYRGSSQYLSLDCNQDSFMRKFGVGFGKDWKARLSRTERED